MLSSFSRLCTLASLATVISGAVIARQDPDIRPSPPTTTVVKVPVEGVKPDEALIFSAARAIDLKDGPAPDDESNRAPPPTIVTSIDGRRTGKGGPRPKRPRRAGGGKPGNGRRAVTDYVQVFAGTGTGVDDRDAAIQGTAYLTHRLVSNATYDVDTCLEFCDSIEGCVFVNLFYEINNWGLDFEASEKSNLKCSAYGDVHSAAEKLNFGGSQSYPPPGPPIHIQHSSGYALKTLVEPEVPEGYEYVFGPTNAYNNANGYMGFVLLDRYDVAACADQCNARSADAQGGQCKYFNIWRAVVDGIPTTYTCMMFFQPTDASTATTTGSSSLQVTHSRGYRRINHVPDSSFESYDCPPDTLFDFCYAESDPAVTAWVAASSPGGYQNAVFFHYPPFARTGDTVVHLGSSNGSDDLPGSVSPAQPLSLTTGKQYRVEFYTQTGFHGVSNPPAWMDVKWNGVTVYQGVRGYQLGWRRHSVDVTSVGGAADMVTFVGGGKGDRVVYLDDISIFEL